MKVEVTMPEEYMGDVIGDINATSWTVSKVWTISAVVRWSKHSFHLQKCSDIQQNFVLRHRDVVTTQCSLRNMSRHLSHVQDKIIACKGKIISIYARKM